MARIKTVDGEIQNVKESVEEITAKLGDSRVVMKLTQIVTVTSYSGGYEKQSQEYEPVYFIKSNIVMYDR